MTTKTKKTQVSHAQFFQLCEEMRNKRETILAMCKSRDDLAVMMRDTMKFPIASSTVRNAMEAIGLRLPRGGRASAKGTHGNNTRIILRTLIGLLNKLGEPVPADVQAAYERTRDGVASSNGHANGAH